MTKLSYPRLLLILGLVSLLALSIAPIGCAKPTPAPAPKPAPAPAPSPPAPKPEATRVGWPKAVTVAASTATGTIYVITVAISDMINKKIGLPANAEAAGGSPAAAKLLQQGMAHLAVIAGFDAIDAYYGIRVQKGNPMKIRGLLNGHQGQFHLVTLTKSGIKTINDMNGRRYQFDKPGSANKAFGDTLVQVAKLNVKTIPWESTEATVKDVAGGTIDIGQTSAIGAGVLRDLFLQQDVTLIPIPDDIRDAMAKTYPGYVKTVIPKGYYQTRGGGKYPPEDLPTIGYDTWVTVRADLPEDLVYQIAKAIMDYPAEFSNYHAEAKYYGLDGAADDPLIPFHPGAIRYYKEKGKWTDTLQKLQDKLLAEEPK